MITFRHVTYQYPQPDEASSADGPALADLSLDIDDGELVLVVGPSGAGKSTLLRCLNGLVPHFHGGRLTGHIDVAGHDPIRLGPQGMNRIVGMVFQDPETQFVTDRVEDELAFGMEHQALPPALMRKRMEEVLDLLTISHLRDRYISTLSGGERQRVAIAAVLTMHPDVLVLDEPTSQLDPQSAEEVLVAIRRLNEDLGLTVILAEHRLERVVQFVDRVLYLAGRGSPPVIDHPRRVMAEIPLNPPLVSLGKAMGWQPLPLTVKQARQFLSRPARPLAGSTAAELATLQEDGQDPRPDQETPLVCAAGLHHAYEGKQVSLRGLDLDLYPGQVVALMGRNGSGKSTLLKLLVGLLKPSRGRVTIRASTGSNGQPQAPPAVLDTQKAAVQEIARIVGYVPQHPGALLFRDSVLEELAFTRQGHGLSADPAADRRLLARLDLDAEAERYPRDLSSGQKQRAALAAIMVAQPQVLLLDEPTRGLDYQQKGALTRILLEAKAEGRAVLLATHDVELVAQVADQVVILAEGRVVVSGSTRQVMTGSLVFASQVNKLYRDPRYLVVDDVLSDSRRAPFEGERGDRTPEIGDQRSEV